jgi:hypothetical protein
LTGESERHDLLLTISYQKRQQTSSMIIPPRRFSVPKGGVGDELLHGAPPMLPRWRSCLWAWLVISKSATQPELQGRVIMQSYSPELIQTMRAALDEVMTKIPLEQATPGIKAAVAECFSRPPQMVRPATTA